ncbi:MAG TPA: hydroxymethylglutaryl-CoA reductase (NADPH) [Thermoanaerobaculia bacterium]|nr:hydroxymethylglutaryl-CoA reductase (NADPH) [Thermoanaerobaculia bacterium]
MTTIGKTRTMPVEPETDRLRQLAGELVRGERRFHALPSDLTADEAARVRRQALEEIGGGSMTHTGNYTLDGERASFRNCENFLGAAQIPLGVIGPLRLRGEYVEGDVYVPLATTEAALVASTNRGCTAIREAGGATVRVEDVGMTRAPVFRTSGIEQSRWFIDWVRQHEGEIRRRTESTSRYLRLVEIRPKAFGTSVFLRFKFDAGDAMGMNMATIACDRVVTEYIEPETAISCIALSGNYCVDKKPADINFQEGRGKAVFAEAVLEGPVLKRCLKTTARDLVEAQYRKNLLGSIAAGSKGFNAHYANVLAAFFIATGQDPAHVVEGSMGVTCIEHRGPEAVYASVYLPAVPIGAVGGGTGLATQSEALRLLGVVPDPERPGAAARRLGEILGGAVLAGELSLMAAFTSQDLARAHERLGRGKLPPGTAI